MSNSLLTPAEASEQLGLTPGAGATPVHRRRSALHQTDRQSGSLSTGRSGRLDCGEGTHLYARRRRRPLTVVPSRPNPELTQVEMGVFPSECDDRTVHFEGPKWDRLRHGFSNQ